MVRSQRSSPTPTRGRWGSPAAYYRRRGPSPLIIRRCRRVGECRRPIGGALRILRIGIALREGHRGRLVVSIVPRVSIQSEGEPIAASAGAIEILHRPLAADFVGLS